MDDATPKMTPCGIVTVMTAPDGSVMASASEFDLDSYGGYTLLASQKMRAEQKLHRAVAEAYCSEIVSNVLDYSDCKNIARRLVSKGNCKITIIPVGHPTTESD